MAYYNGEEHDPILIRKRKEHMEKFAHEARQLFNDFDDALFGEYIAREEDQYFLNHFHCCDYYLKNGGLFGGPHTGENISTILAQKACKNYLDSVGKVMDEAETVCDECPHSRLVFVDDDGKILFVY